MINNAYAEYEKNLIGSMSPEYLTLELYKGAIKFSNFAKESFNKNDLEGMHNNIIKVERIIEYLAGTLNEQYEVSQDFIKIYNIIMEYLIDANIHKNVESLDVVIKFLKDVKSTWVECINKTKEKN